MKAETSTQNNDNNFTKVFILIAFTFLVSFTSAFASELKIGRTFTSPDKAYDATTNATMSVNNLALVGVEDGDVVALTNVTVAFTSANAGNDITAEIISANIQGEDAD